MQKRELQYGDVVQIGHQESGFFNYAFMMVTEPFSWGAQGYVAVPGERGTVPGKAFVRVEFKDMEFVGRASWVPDKTPVDER